MSDLVTKVVVLDKQQIKAITKISKEMDRSFSYMVRLSINSYIESNKV